MSEPREGARGLCAHCGEPITFKPWFILDKGLPNPPVWWHIATEAKSCSIQPEGWKGAWPMAEPDQMSELAARVDELTVQLKRADEAALGYRLRAERLQAEIDSASRGSFVKVTATAVVLTRAMEQVTQAMESHIVALKDHVGEVEGEDLHMAELPE